MKIVGHTTQLCRSCERQTDHLLVEVDGILLKFCTKCKLEKEQNAASYADKTATL